MKAIPEFNDSEWKAENAERERILKEGGEQMLINYESMHKFHEDSREFAERVDSWNRYYIAALTAGIIDACGPKSD